MFMSNKHVGFIIYWNKLLNDYESKAELNKNMFLLLYQHMEKYKLQR